MTGDLYNIFTGIGAGIPKQGYDDLVELPVCFDKQAHVERMTGLRR